MSKRDEPQQACAGTPDAPRQEQVEAAITRVLDAVTPVRPPAKAGGGALRRADEIGRATPKAKPRT